MADLLCGIGSSSTNLRPAIGSSAFNVVGHGQLWTCHRGASLVGTIWYAMTMFCCITVVLTMMSKINVVALDCQWISMVLVHFKISREAILDMVKTVSQMIGVLQQYR
jgi:hypothetical protein